MLPFLLWGSGYVWDKNITHKFVSVWMWKYPFFYWILWELPQSLISVALKQIWSEETPNPAKKNNHQTTRYRWEEGNKVTQGKT